MVSIRSLTHKFLYDAPSHMLSIPARLSFNSLSVSPVHESSFFSHSKHRGCSIVLRSSQLPPRIRKWSLGELGFSRDITKRSTGSLAVLSNDLRLTWIPSIDLSLKGRKSCSDRLVLSTLKSKPST